MIMEEVLGNFEKKIDDPLTHEFTKSMMLTKRKKQNQPLCLSLRSFVGE